MTHQCESPDHLFFSMSKSEQEYFHGAAHNRFVCPVLTVRQRSYWSNRDYLV